MYFGMVKLGSKRNGKIMKCVGLNRTFSNKVLIKEKEKLKLIMNGFSYNKEVEKSHCGGACTPPRNILF